MIQAKIKANNLAKQGKMKPGLFILELHSQGTKFDSIESSAHLRP